MTSIKQPKLTSNRFNSKARRCAHALQRSLPVFTVLLIGIGKVDAQRSSAWQFQQEAGPYVIRSDFKLTKVPGLVDKLVKLENDIDRLLHIGTPSERVYLYLFRNKRSYQEYVRKHFPDVPDRKAIYIKKGGPGMVFAYLSNSILVDLRHETTHALLHANLAMVPLWLDEGLAEYFEVASKERMHGNRHLRAVKWKNRLGRLRSIEALEGISDITRMRQSEYEESWSWIHFILHDDPQIKAELLSYISDIKNLNPPGKLSRRLRAHKHDLDSCYRKHVRSWPSRPALVAGQQSLF